MRLRSEASVCVQRLQDDPLQASLETVMPLDQLNEEDKVLPSFLHQGVGSADRAGQSGAALQLPLVDLLVDTLFRLTMLVTGCSRVQLTVHPRCMHCVQLGPGSFLWLPCCMLPGPAPTQPATALPCKACCPISAPSDLLPDLNCSAQHMQTLGAGSWGSLVSQSLRAGAARAQLCACPMQSLTAAPCAQVLHVPSFVPANVDKVAGIISRQPGIDALRMGRQVGPPPLNHQPPSMPSEVNMLPGCSL